jgi:hypothetical protein
MPTGLATMRGARRRRLRALQLLTYRASPGEDFAARCPYVSGIARPHFFRVYVGGDAKHPGSLQMTIYFLEERADLRAHVINVKNCVDFPAWPVHL